jgi:hypothetical protein
MPLWFLVFPREIICLLRCSVISFLLVPCVLSLQVHRRSFPHFQTSIFLVVLPRVAPIHLPCRGILFLPLRLNIIMFDGVHPHHTICLNGSSCPPPLEMLLQSPCSMYSMPRLGVAVVLDITTYCASFHNVSP